MTLQESGQKVLFFALKRHFLLILSSFLQKTANSTFQKIMTYGLKQTRSRSRKKTPIRHQLQTNWGQMKRPPKGGRLRRGGRIRTCGLLFPKQAP